MSMGSREELNKHFQQDLSSIPLPYLRTNGEPALWLFPNRLGVPIRPLGPGLSLAPSIPLPTFPATSPTRPSKSRTFFFNPSVVLSIHLRLPRCALRMAAI